MTALASSPLLEPTSLQSILVTITRLPPLLSRLPTALLAFPASPPAPVSTSTAALPVGYTQSRLPSIDPSSLALHYALYKFQVTNLENYARLPYEEAFNWQDLLLPEELEREWYIVAFRSVRKLNALSSETAKLYQADREAHEEAVTAGGLLLYWYGSPNERGENLATCIWQSRQHALQANRNPKHAFAAHLAASTYATYHLERYILRKERGTRHLKVEPWHGGEVGY